MLQDNVEGYRKEIASLREKEQKMAAATQKHEQTVHTLKEDLRAAKEKLAMAEVNFSSIIPLSFFFFFKRAVCAWGWYLSILSSSEGNGSSKFVFKSQRHLTCILWPLRAMLRAYVRRETCWSWWSPGWIRKKRHSRANNRVKTCCCLTFSLFRYFSLISLT